MKDSISVIKCRDEMQYCIDGMSKEIRELRQDKLWNELPEETKKYLSKLYALQSYYKNQIIGINFCLNEDSKLDNYQWNSNFSGNQNIEKFIYDKTQ